MAHRVCPWWLGHLQASPLRRLLDNPEKILAPYVAEGMTVLDVGCGMGFFSLPMAERVGPEGRVVCVDLQKEMIAGLLKRAGKARLSRRIDARICAPDHLGIDDLSERVDFALAFAVMHEVQDKERLLAEIFSAMKAGGKVLIAEPIGHVSKREFGALLPVVRKIGFDVVALPSMVWAHAILLQESVKRKGWSRPPLSMQLTVETECAMN